MMEETRKIAGVPMRMESLSYIVEKIKTENKSKYLVDKSLKNLKFDFNMATEGGETFLYFLAKQSIDAMNWKLEQSSSKEELVSSEEWLENSNNTFDILEYLKEEYDSDRSELLRAHLLGQSAFCKVHLKGRTPDRCCIEANDVAIKLTNKLFNKDFSSNADKELCVKAENLSKFISRAFKNVMKKLEQENGNLTKSNDGSLNLH